jgi:hypothetical protein
MITINGHDITDILVGRTGLTKVCRGVRLVWQKLRSCFGTGVWLNDRPWLNEDVWKNNK